MKMLIVRSLLFATLWTLYLYHHFHQSKHLAILLFISSIVIGSYFFVSAAKRPLVLYIAIDFLLVLAEWRYPLSNHMYSLLLLLYVYTESIFRLPHSAFRVLTCFHLLCSSMIILMKTHQIEWLFILMLLSSISVLFNQNMSEKEEQRQLYEQLLGEYRRLKRLNYQTERAARLEERTRIARDIHDSVGHKLTALLMQLEMLSIKNPREEYEELKHFVRESLEETRHAVRALKTEEHEGISSVLQLIRKLESESHILVHFTIKRGALSVRLTNQQNVVLYRVIQESLTNAMRHAQSREVFVILGKSAVGELEFLIKNRIFDPKPFQLGFGLKNMKERVKEVGGTLRVFQTNEEFVIQGTLLAKEVS
ncbi:signal transduction histidine kinase [Thermolongibacillus altinsuensis]|uniref:histidine kinase n=1 Tax=Thermolongibacillus altinsuensis TaxID=575256 RepID=A0A4R1QCZ0_9BACL|nr:histidine kinase [Thermolongibacillus altinsuensis]TCL45006.1 signal transduction histidine kinase [Thermolongibacillus altinsuensis]